MKNHRWGEVEAGLEVTGVATEGQTSTEHSSFPALVQGNPGW